MATPRITLVIQLMDDGTLQCQGPLQDRVACYGLLEAAKDIVRTYQVDPPRSIPAAGLGNGGHPLERRAG